MSWIEVKARYEPAPADMSPFIDIFLNYGIENTLEDGGQLIGCLVDVEGSQERVDELQAALENSGATEISIKPLEEVNWEEAWKQFFKPRRVGKKFLIRPTWEEFASEPGDMVIVLDPGQAFGTGDHPTTRMCLELMEAVPIEGKTVADIGCGSGILAVGACLMNAASVEAVDIDPLAVEVAKENAAINNVSFRAIAGEGVIALLDDAAANASAGTIVQQDDAPLTGDVKPSTELKSADRQFDLVISNIISATLIRISPDVALITKPSGYWIVSGIIVQNWPDVLEAAGKVGFTLEQRLEEDGWVAARFIKA